MKLIKNMLKNSVEINTSVTQIYRFYSIPVTLPLTTYSINFVEFIYFCFSEVKQTCLLYKLLMDICISNVFR